MMKITFIFINEDTKINLIECYRHDRNEDLAKGFDARLKTRRNNYNLNCY